MPNIFTQRNGWIGVDLGTTSAKFAQIEQRNGHRVVVAASYYAYDQPINSTSVLNGDLTSLQEALDSLDIHLPHLRELFNGPEIAVCLSSSFTPIHSMELPAADEQEMSAMISEEIAAESATSSNASIGYWANMLGRSPDPSTLAISAVAASEELTDCISNWLWRFRYEPVVMDVQYCAMARLAKEDRCPDDVSLAIDIGHESTTLVVCRNGNPLHARKLRSCGLKQIIAPICEYLELSNPQAYMLLTEFAIKAERSAITSTERLVADLISVPLQFLLAELRKTIDFYDARMRDGMPSEIVLYGGAAGIANVSHILSSQLGLPVRVWSMEHNNTSVAGRPIAVFANAISMSSLMWESTKCT